MEQTFRCLNAKPSCVGTISQHHRSAVTQLRYWKNWHVYQICTGG